MYHINTKLSSFKRAGFIYLYAIKSNQKVNYNSHHSEGKENRMK